MSLLKWNVKSNEKCLLYYIWIWLCCISDFFLCVGLCSIEHYNQLCLLSVWTQFRLVITEKLHSREFYHHKQQSADKIQVRDSFCSVDSVSDYNRSFWECAELVLTEVIDCFGDGELIPKVSIWNFLCVLLININIISREIANNNDWKHCKKYQFYFIDWKQIGNRKNGV